MTKSGPARTPATGGRWVLIIHQIPPHPPYFRVKVGRRLQRLGAVAIKNSVYVLPRSDETVEDLQWQLREIVAEGGEASVCEAAFVDGLRDTEIEALFRKAREADYRAISAAARALQKAPGDQLAPEVSRLKRRLAEVAAIDFFGAPSRRAAQGAVARLDARRVRRKGAGGASGVSGPTPRAATWVTRRGVYVDRIASAWLIRRFIDPKARFKFVAAKGYRPKPRELRYDMFDAEYTHEGEACTFETLVGRFAVRDLAVRAIGEIVHDIDYKEPKFGRAETAGVERVLGGIARRHPEDLVRLKLGGTLLDALYDAFTPAT